MDSSLQHAATLRPLHYDAVRRRLWICGQRCHHGATGALLTGLAAVGLASTTFQPRRALTMLATGTMLMAHDWHDRPVWFQRGWQNEE